MRVVHVVKHYGEPSQTFVADAVAETDRLGWEAWIATRSVVGPGLASEPRVPQNWTRIEPTCPRRSA